MTISGSCGIPDTARAAVVNVTVVQPSAKGYLVLHAGDLAPDGTTTINFGSGQVRSNNAIVSLALDGSGTLAASPVVEGGGTVHLIVDASVYLE